MNKPSLMRLGQAPSRISKKQSKVTWLDCNKALPGFSSLRFPGTTVHSGVVPISVHKVMQHCAQCNVSFW